ncbi:LPS assembly lipoprotein LptE [Oxalobacter sp. OttesenSCG-928-P03]|nr:LPS assembly lipoprotein LptE [Oxalobacter sp. OttesenSCG-928-P03]
MRRYHTISGLLLLVASLFLLSACGFALRGSAGDFRLPFETLYINVETNDLFGATLKRQIESTGTKVINDKKQADAQLEILERERERETLSLSTAGRTREYALFYTFRFQVKDRENNILMDTVQIRLRRTLTYSESQAYAKQKEEDMLYEDMENDVMLQVIRRLANIEVDRGLSAGREPEL